MKKAFGIGLIVMSAIMMTGCSGKFEPTESTLFVTSKGQVRSAVMESFDKAYYNFEELSEEVNAAVQSYCLDKNEETVTVDVLAEENEMVTLQMTYATVEDYEAFNEVLLFSGSYAEAKKSGYIPEKLVDSQGQEIELTAEEAENLKVIVTEEAVCIQTTGNVLYVSENVTIVDKKLAKALEAGKTHPAFVLYK